MKAERILYTPSAGFLVALAACLPPLCRRARSPALPWGVLGLVVALFAARTWARNADWHDNYALAVATLNTSPHSPPFHTILANWHRDRRENEPRRQHLLQALEQMPREPCYLFNLGNFWLDEKKYDEAIACYQQALEVNPNYISALNNLGRACHESRRYPEAAAAFQRVVALRPNAFTGYINLVTACQMLNQPAAALPVAEEASRRFPNEAGVFWVLCGVYKSLGRTNEAKRAFNRALQLDPGITTRKDLKTRR
jgi:tetratricopeptide (TPR) repeat protein